MRSGPCAGSVGLAEEGLAEADHSLVVHSGVGRESKPTCGPAVEQERAYCIRNRGRVLLLGDVSGRRAEDDAPTLDADVDGGLEEVDPDGDASAVPSEGLYRACGAEVGAAGACTCLDASAGKGAYEAVVDWGKKVELQPSAEVAVIAKLVLPWPRWLLLWRQLALLLLLWPHSELLCAVPTILSCSATASLTLVLGPFSWACLQQLWQEQETARPLRVLAKSRVESRQKEKNPLGGCVVLLEYLCPSEHAGSCCLWAFLYAC